MSSHFDRRPGAAAQSNQTGIDSSSLVARKSFRRRSSTSFGRKPDSTNTERFARRNGNSRRDDNSRLRNNPNENKERRSGKGRFGRRGSRSIDLLPSRLLSAQPEILTGEISNSDALPKDFLWGRHATQTVLKSGRPIHRIWCTAELRSTPRFLQLLRDAKSSGILIEEVTWARLAQLTNGAVHQGIVLQVAAAETLSLTSLIEGCASLKEPALLLALDGLTDPHNLGAILRSAEVLGAHGVVLPQRRSAGLTGSVAKVAAGALEHIPVARVVNLNHSLEILKEAGYRVIGLAEEGDQTLGEVSLTGPLVVVTGSESRGLSLLSRRKCDQLVRIPLRGITPSLNASVATALCLYEIARRGWMRNLRGQSPAPPIIRPHRMSEQLAARKTNMQATAAVDLCLDRHQVKLVPLVFDHNIEL